MKKNLLFMGGVSFFSCLIIISFLASKSTAHTFGKTGTFKPTPSHLPIPFEALKTIKEQDDISFCDIKPEFITSSCVSCHINKGVNLDIPRNRDKNGKKAEAYYLGGKMGTVFSANSGAFEQPSPAIKQAGLDKEFLAGEGIFEGVFVADPHVPFGGLGPTYQKTSCISCHPGYGRGKRTDNFDKEYTNGYIAIVHNPDGSIVKGYTPMLHTKALEPFKPYAKGVKITWNNFIDKYNNKYPDGTSYNKGKKYEGTLIYPTADIIEPLLPLPKDYKVSIESTIGIYGTALLDAIKDDDIIEEFRRQQSIFGPVKGMHGPWIKEPNGQTRLGKFTWHNTRATLENGPGSNGVFSTTNITREDQPNLYATKEWIEKHKELGIDTSSLEKKQPVELSKTDFENFMIWHRGLAVPAARNLEDLAVQKGRELFYEMGCVSCHKPEWKTGSYPAMPAYENQIIRPYTDMLMHDMGEENQGQFRTYRTPPLWGRGLMKMTANHTDMFHDLRARDFEEAILWHFGEAEFSRELFRNLSEKDRQNLIKFLEAL